MLCSSALSLYWGLQRWECHTCHVTHVYYSLHFLSSPLTNTLRECVVDSEFLCDEMCSRKQTEIRIVFWVFLCMCGCECECVPRSPLFVCPLWALYLRVSPSVGGTNRSANAERKDVRFASAALKARQNKSSTRLLGYTSTPALKQKTWSTAQKMWRKVYF